VVARLRSRCRPGPLSESVALVPICQTRRPSANTLRLWRRTRRKQKRALELAARNDIDLIGLGQVLPEQVPRTILVRASNDETVRADRPGPGRGCLGRLRAAPLLRVRPPGQSCRPDPRQPAAPGPAPEVRPARGLENGLVRPGRQRVNVSFERYYLDLPSTRGSWPAWGGASFSAPKRHSGQVSFRDRRSAQRPCDGRRPSFPVIADPNSLQ